MSEFIETVSQEDANAVIDSKLRKVFDGRIVRKDLTKKIKEGANVPVYVLEFLLGQYCSSDDEDVIETGVANVKRILAENYVRPDEAQKILSVLRQRGSYTVIDKITVNLNIKTDSYEAEFSNLGIKAIPISEDYPTKYDRLLCGGIWCIVQLEYEYVEEDKRRSPILIHKLTPIQMPHVDIEELKQGRKAFTQEEWIKILLRSIGMEPDKLNDRERWLLLARMLPLVENNFNLCELGPRSTGKSHIYKEISPNSILVSGGQTTVANLFYNMGRKTVGLVGLWDCVAFPECTSKSGSDPIGKHDPYAADDFHVYIYCLAKLDGTNTIKFYRTEDRTLKRGEAVFVPDESSGSKLRGTICSIEHHMSFSVPKPVEETPEIIGRA